MSANLELVQDVIRRWNTGDRTLPEDRIDPDIEFVSRGLMEGRRLRGIEGFREWFREIDEQFDQWTIEVDEWHESGDYIVGLGRVHIHGRESGIPFDQPIGWLFEFRGNLAIRFETFVEDPADALAAAGLAE